MTKRLALSTAVVMTLSMLLACGPKELATTPSITTANPTPNLSLTPTPTVKVTSGKYLTPNPVETEKPIYGGTLSDAITGLRGLDAHQLIGYGPTATLPIFNQLVMFDINYKETVPETIVGDLAESWETSQDGKNITFHLRRGIKWQDGVPFSADDVTYSLEKMTDVNRSAIKDWFPAFDSVDKIDEYTVVVHLKYASASFMLMLAQGESQIQPLHLAGTDPQSAAFGVGTGPFILTEYVPGVNLKYKRNQEYWKKDKGGNQLPYLDGIIIYIMPNTPTDQALIARRLDLKGTVTGASTLDWYNTLKNGAPELLWQKRNRYSGFAITINTKHKPLDDIRVRRALGLVLKQEDLIIGSLGDVMFGLPDSGVLHPAFGVPKDEIIQLMGWDKPYDQRVAEAQQLITEAGYPNGFELNVLASAIPDANLVFADVLRTKLKVNAVVHTQLGTIEMQKRLKEDNYDLYSWQMDVTDPNQLANYFATDGHANWSKYSNPDVDKMLADLDYILDPEQRRETIWAIDRTLLTNLPVLPTGIFPTNFMPYYPWVKNLRWSYISYSNINRLEDIWIDMELKAKMGG